MKLIKCQCEHDKHFDDTPKHRGHEYGKEFPSVMTESIRTDYGTFHVCRECSETCLKRYTVQALPYSGTAVQP